jgi:hypothetical protein
VFTRDLDLRTLFRAVSLAELLFSPSAVAARVFDISADDAIELLTVFRTTFSLH